MKFNYKFSNLLGTVYRNGNLVFSPDGNSVLSPVGNKISCFDLKNNNSSTLPIESRFNYTSVALSPNGVTLLSQSPTQNRVRKMTPCLVIAIAATKLIHSAVCLYFVLALATSSPS